MKDFLQIIIPTFDNPQFLDPCVASIIKTGILTDGGRLFIVNNGKQPIKDRWGYVNGIEILEPGENLGWERGLELALKHSDAPFVVFQNDDTFIPSSSCRIYQRMLTNFLDRNVAAVGPATTTASGLQRVYDLAAPVGKMNVNWLIFFMVMVKRADLDAVGGIDTTLPGGDDFDLSIRLRKAGKKIIIDPGAFLIHHGFQTGNRVHGGPETINGWNSMQMVERTRHALIKKHGFRTFVEYYYRQSAEIPTEIATTDLEGDIVREFARGEKIIELGCGGKKTVENATGIDRIPPGEEIPHLAGIKSVADVVANVEEPLPLEMQSQDVVIARHILEHCIDAVSAIQNWNEILKRGGRLIIAVPDEAVTAGIPLNNEHCHAFTAASLKSLAEACGFRQLDTKSSGNGISFVSCFEKIDHVVAKRELSHA